MKIRRKFCKLHGWAPHRTWRYEGERIKSCCRCNGVVGLSRTETIKAFFRGFKLPRGIRARTFLGDRFSE